MIAPIPLSVTATLAAVDPVAVGNDFARHAEGAPITVGFFMLFFLFAAALAWLLLKAWPQWLTEQATNRTHHKAENEKTRAHMDSMMNGERAASKERHSEIVGRVSDKVDKLHEKIDGLHSRTGAIAAKLGITTVTALIVAGALLGLLRVSAPSPIVEPTQTAETCNPPCSTGQKCSGSPPHCVEDKKDLPAVTKPAPKPSNEPKRAATLPDGGHSAKQFKSYATLVSVLCNSRVEVCL